MKRLLVVMLTFAVAAGMGMLATPSAHAGTVTSIEVHVGNTTWCNVENVAGACAAGPGVVHVAAWTFGAGIVIPVNNALVLTQTGGGTNNFDFDTSEGTLPSCSAATPCATSLFINGTAVPLANSANSVLANGNIDPGTAAHNEAANWTLANGGVVVAGGHLFQVDFGYADNIHTDPCADADGNCFPGSADRWGSIPFQLLGGGTAATGFPNPPTTANHCIPTNPDCFDAGAIRIVELTRQVPEPASLLLLGAGLIGLAAWGGRRFQKVS